jgi:ubiquinone/menaquinone biosynthesis C-methylase UbiE
VFTRSAAFYDLLYSFKNYGAEAAKVRLVIEQAKRSSGRRLLDVACGTGQHLEQFRDYFECEGLDLDPELLAIARRRLPGLSFTQADMTSFHMGRCFDAVVCLGSSIGYVGTLDNLRLTARTLTRHVAPGGVIVVEPWLTPDTFRPGHVQVLVGEGTDVKVTRMSSSELTSDRWLLHLHYLVGGPAGVEYFTEEHALGLFTTTDYVSAFADAGLQVSHDPYGLSGRGLLVGVK